MMMMDGAAAPGLILDEGGDVWAYGILANNEWRSGWMDEGLTSYQTSWALGLTPQERARSGRVEPPARLAEGYRVNAITIPRRDSAGLGMLRLELLGRTEPVGTAAHDFREFTVYNAIISIAPIRCTASCATRSATTRFAGFSVTTIVAGRSGMSTSGRCAHRPSGRAAATSDGSSTSGYTTSG